MAIKYIFSNVIGDKELQAQKDIHIEDLECELSITENDDRINYLKGLISITKDKDIECYHSEAVESNNLWFADELQNLYKTIEGEIICIADLGLWNGRKQGYKILSNSLTSILTNGVNGDKRVFIDTKTKQIKCENVHHDGTNIYLYREIRKNRNINVLLNKIYNGEEITPKLLNYYTKSLYNYIKDIYII